MQYKLRGEAVGRVGKDAVAVLWQLLCLKEILNTVAVASVNNVE